MTGKLLAIVIFVATAVFVVIGTMFPVESAVALAGTGASLLASDSSPHDAVVGLLREIGRRDYTRAYDSLANKSEFSQGDFIRDIQGSKPSLRTTAGLDSFDVEPGKVSGDEAIVRGVLHWSSVVGLFQDKRDFKVVRHDGRWEVAWPLVKEARTPPQVIPVNYLRWDVIYRGSSDDWGLQDVEAPHVRIIDMHPVQRGIGVVILGEILNEDTVPAYVDVRGILLDKGGKTIASETAFDKMSHILLPKQVTPFRIDFRNVSLSQVDSLRMEPNSNLIAASADPVIEIENQSLVPAPDAALHGQLVNQSGESVDIAHVIGTFYDSTGQVVWVDDGYLDRSLAPTIAQPFSIAIPTDLSSKITSYRVITASYGSGNNQ